MKKIFLFLILFAFKTQAQVTLTTIYDTPDSRINLYIVSQGYTSATMSQFDGLVTEFLNALWATPPYASYQTRFRVITVKDIASVDTYPRAPIQYNLVCTAGDDAGAQTDLQFRTSMDNLVATNIPGYDDHSFVIAIFNNGFYSGGGGKYVFGTDWCSTSPTDYYANTMYEVLIHEFSHKFALLGDEYEDNTATGADPNAYTLFFDRNITQFTAQADVPWNYLITSPMPYCPAPPTCTSSSGIGLYEGANYSTTGWYRPDFDCKMRSLGVGFCQNCQDIIEETIKKHLCNATLSVTENFSSRHQYLVHWRKASNQLTSTSTIGNKISVRYTSENDIILQSGFWAKAGSDFIAYEADCDYIDLINLYKPVAGSIDRSIEPPGIAAMSAFNGMKISPNPSSSLVNIALNQNTIKSLTLYTVEGKAIYSSNDLGMMATIDLSAYAKGVYIIKVQTDADKIFTQKIIKE